jgi:hypothetical protein
MDEKKLLLKVRIALTYDFRIFRTLPQKEKNEITLEIEPIVSKYLWNKVNNI